MSPQSTAFSLLAIASLFSSSIAFPLEALNIVPRQAYSIVNVDGSSSPTSEPAPQAVTQTVTDVETAALPTSTLIATVNVDRGSATETIYLTVTPTPTPTPTPAPQPTVIVLPPPSIPYYPLPLNSTSSSTSTSETSTIPLSTATSSEPCDETPEPTPEPTPTGDGAPWRHSYIPVPTGTGTAYPTGGYNAPIAARPSGMTEPLPVLPPAAPYWFNITEIPNVRKRVIVS